MDLSFGSEGLAALYSSERRMAEQWGPTMGRTVGRRLLDLGAVTAATISRIPTAVVATDGKGETTITFEDVIVMRGVISSGSATGRGAADPDQFVIESIEMQEGAAR
jgi:hypothetical protein